MIRYPTSGSSQWLNVDAIYPRGNIAQVPTDEWQQLQMIIQFDDSMVDSSQTSDLSLYVAPFSDIDTIDIDDFIIESAIPFQNHIIDTEQQSCTNLLFNGQADLFSAGHAYPFYPTGGVLSVISSPDNNSFFFRNSLRTSRWASGFSQDISTECLRKAAIYKFSASFRVVNSNNINPIISIRLVVSGIEYTIIKCPATNNQWTYCTGNFQMTEQHEDATSARIMTYINDDSSIIDISNVSFVYQGGRSIQLVLEEEEENSDGSFSHDCWGKEAEILVTSHTIRHEDSQIAKIESVDPDTGIITLQEPINKPITLDDDPNTGVEVALLTRNILFTAADDDTGSPLDGGHMIIMHTSAPVTQTVMGVESHNFGQQGKLGRYPFHFHMCGSVAGSTLSKNSVRNTKQRGIVVHGTDDLYLEGNILHNHRGHGFLLEDGGEQGNTFIKNLGAVGHPVDIRISNDESDTAPATFWITNPQNTWIGNVAAGSQFSGFWFEVSSRVRGPSASKFPDMIPNKLDLQKFVDNISHSNAQGLQTYPQSGYRPKKLAVFKNHKSFRNRNAGVFFHAGGRLSIDGGYLSDNKIGVDIDMDHSDVISNTVIVGRSDAYEEVVNSLGYKATQRPAAALCPSANDSLVGIRLDSYHDGSLFGATGSSVSSVTFSGFGSGSCGGSSILHVDADDMQYFDTRNRLTNIQIIDDSPKINLCGAEKQVAIRLEDGSFMGKPGFIISDTNAIRSHPDCISDSGSCSAFCPEVCLRTMTVMIPSFYERGSLKLEVTGTLSDGRSIIPVSIQDFQTKELRLPQKEGSQGRFFVTLPAGGKYNAKFLMDNQEVWPHYTDLQYEDKVDSCGANFDSFKIDQLSQLLDLSLENLINNGNFEAGTQFWWYLGLQGMKLMDGGANGTPKSLLAPNTAEEGGGRHIGLGQYLDTRYFEEGYVYTLTAYIKLTDSRTGEKFQCDLDAYSGAINSCPKANFRFTNHLEENEHMWRNLGTMQETNNEWNLMTGSYIANMYDATAHSIFLYINGAPVNVNIQIDEVLLVRSLPTTAPSSIPTALPSYFSSQSPSAYPTTSPIQGITPTSDLVPSLFEISNTESIILGGETVNFETTSGLDSTVLSRKPHIGTGTTNDLEFIVYLLNRDISDSGYQPQLVLFFAPAGTSIDQLTTNDNGFQYFEASVVAWMKEKIYCCNNYTYLQVNSLVTDGTDDTPMMSGTESVNTKMISGSALRLKRSGGNISAYYSFDNGQSWTQFGLEYELPEEFQTAPLKMGYRIKREWKSTYNIATKPSILSGGEIEDDIAEAPAPEPYFGLVTLSSSDNVQAVTLSKNSIEVFEGDISLIVKVDERVLFSTGYQSGLWLFFATAETSTEEILSTTNDADFKNLVVAAVGDKIHYSCCEHTWAFKSWYNKEGQREEQGGGDSYKNMNGYLKLERINGAISAWMSPNGNGWKEIGSTQELPDNLATSPLKVGLRMFKNWAPGYLITASVDFVQN
eukprot:CAMPEP_0194160216 /NCGR_PEP_ID=MMETSP0152-20130528/78270_1 /TAXON_ID=1049557 /ORGANISM="Thalassiothrix antarctica, Strain L6-D1" /LENGTH=1486 /DNA_ID=CAMNT_0038869883 /DNA_START=967 /DNA_END=5427 /DNA_ORIENTATION=-